MGFWIAGAVAVVAGHELGAGHPGVGMLLTVFAVLLAGFGLASASTARHVRVILAIAALFGLAGRGALAAAQAEHAAWRGPRGPAQGVRTLEVERASHPGPRCRVRVRSAGVALWLDAPASACPLAQGHRIRVRADRLRRQIHPALPGDPSPTSWARARGARTRASVDRVWRAGGRPHVYWWWVARQRQRAWTLTRGDPAASFVVAAVLGVRSALDPDRRAALRRAGLGHLVAVSGLHVGLAAWVLLAVAMRLGARLGGGPSGGVVLSWIVLVGYVLLTGASPPAVRAALMAVGVGLGGLWGRPHHGPVLLAATCVVMLGWRPAWAFDPGFQLSVVAMAVLTRAPVGEGVVRQTWRVTWAVMPISLWHFGQAGAWGLLVNLIAVPVFTLWVLPLGMLGWLGVGWLGSAALAPAAWGARPIVELAQWVATWPSVSRIDLGIAAGLAVVLGLCVGRRDREGRLRPGWRWLPPLPVALGVLLVVGWPRPSPSVSSRWWAVGHPTAPAVVTMAVEPEHDRTIACVHSVAVAASRWPRLLDAMGADAATWSREGPRAPHEQDLERVLQQRRQWVDGPVACPAPPSMEQVKAGLRACRRRSTRRHSMLVMADDGPRCFVRGRWEGPISGRVE